MKSVQIVLVNAIVSCCVAYVVARSLPTRLPETIKCKRLEASESVDTRQLVTGYVWVGVPGCSGRQGSISMSAGRDWAGINVSDGNETDSLWVESRDVK